ncbi:MAG: Spy/CpxP family protein refolding chaperone [Candidatus Omnitrophica bacterium]|nr:Spy/CpxP family protein refolding chaperone [Candidatus Omnitrophota bacterium]
MKKLKIVMMIVLAMFLFGFVSSAFAFHGEGEGRAPKPGSCPHMMQGGDYSRGSYCKIGILLSKAEELNLTESQIKAMMELKNRVDKQMINYDAQIGVVMIDLRAMMCQDDLNKAEIDKLIDKKYEIKKEKAKYITSTMVEVNSLLTPDQKKAYKSMMKNKCKK